jgi:hypothetical protein
VTKHAYIEAFFPELPGGKCYQTAHGEASTAKAAISRAVGSVLKQVKGRRLKTIKATIILSTIDPGTEGAAET